MCTYEIGKTFEFAASHQLDTLPDDHKCRRLHGHNYTVEVVLGTDELDEHGFVLDYGDLAIVRRWIDTTLDHRHLNDVLERPTAERLAAYLFDVITEECRIPDVIMVRVSEQPRTWATFRPCEDCR